LDQVFEKWKTFSHFYLPVFGIDAGERKNHIVGANYRADSPKKQSGQFFREHGELFVKPYLLSDISPFNKPDVCHNHYEI